MGGGGEGEGNEETDCTYLAALCDIMGFIKSSGNLGTDGVPREVM